MPAQRHTEMHELDSRLTDGIHVRLLWGRHDDRVVVAVDDAKTGERFDVEVRRHERALDVFHHPFAYAALWGNEPRSIPVLA